MKSKIAVTSSDLYHFSTCPNWVWYDYYGDPSEKRSDSDFSRRNFEAGKLHERRYVLSLDVIEVKDNNFDNAVHSTLACMKNGVPLIYQGWIQAEINGVIYHGRPDLLEKRSGSSVFGDWIYVPIDIKSSAKIKPIHKQQLAFYCIILEQVQGVFPSTPAIVNIDFQSLEVVSDEDDLKETRKIINEVIEIKGGKKPPLYITSSIRDKSPWYAACLNEAKKHNDICLIYGLQNRTIQALRSYGINTIQAMAAQDINALPKIPYASTNILNRAKKQAQSLIENRPIHLSEPKVTNQPGLKLYFDVEGEPQLEIEYLFGFWVVGDPDRIFAQFGNIANPELKCEKYFLYFLSEEPFMERIMWEQFLRWLHCLPPEYEIYHYANYEQKTLVALAEKYQGSSDLNKFRERAVDLSEQVKHDAVFPVYFYSLKDIAKSIGFKWRHKKAGGGQSICWYEKWLETKDRSVLQEIINYNEDDVRATEHLHLWFLNTTSLKEP